MAKPWNYFPCYFEWAEPPIVTILIIKVYLYSQSILIQWSKLCWVAIPLFCLFSSSFILDHPRSRLILDLCGSTDFFFFRSQAWILPFLLGIVLLILCPLCSKERFGWEEEVWKLKFPLLWHPFHRVSTESVIAPATTLLCGGSDCLSASTGSGNHDVGFRRLLRSDW